MTHAFIASALRTPIGRYGGSLAEVRADDLGAIPLKALMALNSKADWAAVDDVIFGCANQAGEDNRNVARMSALLAGFDTKVSGSTVNRLCGSGLDALGTAARAIMSGDTQFMIAGGVESMTRAPFVQGKATSAFSRSNELYDTTIGWRFINAQMRALHGVDSMPETAENVAEAYQISRADQDAFAVRSQAKAAAAQASSRFDVEISPVTVPKPKGETVVVSKDEHPRATTIEALAQLKPIVKPGGSVTAGNASGVNDGAAALIVVSEAAAARHGFTPRARVVATAAAGVPPRVMGVGPIPATQKVLAMAGLGMGDMDIIELNEAFASQGLAVLRELGLADDDERVNPNGGAIALGHPLGMTGARLALTATEELQRRKGRYALCTMCIGGGQGIAVILERV